MCKQLMDGYFANLLQQLNHSTSTNTNTTSCCSTQKEHQQHEQQQHRLILVRDDAALLTKRQTPVNVQPRQPRWRSLLESSYTSSNPSLDEVCPPSQPCRRASRENLTVISGVSATGVLAPDDNNNNNNSPSSLNNNDSSSSSMCPPRFPRRLESCDDLWALEHKPEVSGSCGGMMVLPSRRESCDDLHALETVNVPNTASLQKANHHRTRLPSFLRLESSESLSLFPSAPAAATSSLSFTDYMDRLDDLLSSSSASSSDDDDDDQNQYQEEEILDRWNSTPVMMH